nr:serine/threonine-protein kinase [Quercus suber]
MTVLTGSLSSGGECFVLKRVTNETYDLSLRLAAEISCSRRLRVHIDCNQEEKTLIYPYFNTTLLALIRDEPEFPPDERKRIVRHVGDAIAELHSKSWVHNDIKPDNILVTWETDKEGQKIVTDAVLGDFDIAFYSEPNTVCNFALLLVMHYGEAQKLKPVEVLYTFGAAGYLLLNNYKDLVAQGFTAEQELITRHFCYFGPMSQNLVKHVDSDDWRTVFEGISEIAEQAIKEDPSLRFTNWGEGLGPEAQDTITCMTKLDPRARFSIDQPSEAFTILRNTQSAATIIEFDRGYWKTLQGLQKPTRFILAVYHWRIECFASVSLLSFLIDLGRIRKLLERDKCSSAIACTPDVDSQKSCTCNGTYQAVTASLLCLGAIVLMYDQRPTSLRSATCALADRHKARFPA